VAIGISEVEHQSVSRRLGERYLQGVVVRRTVAGLNTDAAVPGGTRARVQRGLYGVLRIKDVDPVGISDAVRVRLAGGMAGGGNGIAVIDENEMASQGSDITRSQHHRSGKLTLHVEVEVIDQRGRVAAIKLVELKWAVVAPVDRCPGSGIGKREGIVGASPGRNVGVRAGEPRTKPCIRRAARCQTKRWRAQVLQLAFFLVAVVVDAESSAHCKIVRAVGTDEHARSGTRRPCQSNARAQVTPFRCRTTGVVATGITGPGHSRRSVFEHLRSVVAAHVEAGHAQLAILDHSVGRFRVPRQPVIEGES